MLLHGWPGDRGDYRDVMRLVSDYADVVAPDLRGFGESDKDQQDSATAYSADAQARSVLMLADELELRGLVVAGYDIGSRIAQAVARAAPGRVTALVLSPPLPGIGQRVLSADAQREFWYQAFHRLDLATDLLDGNPAAVRAYLRHFWSHWSGPRFPMRDADLDRLVREYSEPGAFAASIGWYRAGSGTVARTLAESAPARDDSISVPTTVLWPEHDPLFPQAWADRLDEFFSNVHLQFLPGVGHFVPVEAPEAFASAITKALSR